MPETKTLTDYDSYAEDFDSMRKPSPLLVNELKKIFGSDILVLSIGCGTGQYEEAFRNGKNIIGLDKSIRMLNLAKKRINYCINGNMLNLPFKDNAFDGVFFMQSLHHLGANFEISIKERNHVRKLALREAVRVLKKGYLLIIQRDPIQNQAVWFWKYFPKALEKKLVIQPPIEVLIKWLKDLGFSKVKAIPVDDPMIKGFYNAEAPLHPSFRKSFSEFSYLTETELENGVKMLKKAIMEGCAQKEIEKCKKNFLKIGGTVFIVSALKERLTL
jgi:SAM-dependent methyltransferase